MEFNIGCGQWNKDKINLLKTLCNEEIDIHELEEKIENARQPKERQGTSSKRKIQTVDGIKYYECNKCHEFKLVSDFRKQTTIIKNSYPCTICKKCTNNKNDEYTNTLRGFLLKKLSTAKSHA